MRSILAAAVAVAMSGLSAGAWAQSRERDFILEPPASLPEGPQTAGRGKPLFAMATYTPRAIALDEDVPTTATNAAGVKLKRPLTKGTVLLGMLDRPWVYCAPIKDGMLYSVAPCLSDKDQDGKFESFVTISFTSAVSDTQAITEDGFIYGSVYDKPGALDAPVAYHAVDYKQGLPAKAQVKWISNWSAKDPGKTVGLGLYLDVGKASTGTGMTGEGENFRLPGGKGTITFNGVKIEVLGFDEKGGLRYQVLETDGKNRRTSFFYRPGTSYIFIYY